MRKFIFIFTVFLIRSVSLPAVDPFVVHYIYGLWDTQPLPVKYRKIQNKNGRALKANSLCHGKDEVLKYVSQFSQEFDPEFFDLFNKIKRKVAQADLGRYLLIYYLGGMYCDIDVVVKKPANFLTDLDYRNGVWLTEVDDVDPSFLGPREKHYLPRLAQFAFFVKEAKSELLLEIILKSIERTKELFQELGDDWSDADILWVTGPDLVTTVIHETKAADFKILDKFQSWELLKHQYKNTWKGGKDIVFAKES